MENTKIVFYKSNERDVARYVSDTTVYEECLQNGRFIQLYRSSSGHVQRENIVAGLPAKDLVYELKKYDPLVYPLNTFELEIDGQSLHNQWSWVESYKRSGKRECTEEAVIKLAHKIRPVTVNVVTRLDGSAILTRYLEITNTGSLPAALSHISVLSGMLWHNKYCFELPFDKSNKSIYSLGYFRSQIQGEEGNFVWQPLASETYRVEKSRGNMYYNPYFILKNEVNGECCFIALAWSENYGAEFAFDRIKSTLSFSIGPEGPAPLRVISPGESVCSPEVHIGSMRSSIDKAVENWYRHLRISVIPPRPADKKMFTVANRVVEEPGDWILREIDIAAEMGTEAFMVDAGWYGKKFIGWWRQRGDWYEGDFLPKGGICAIRDYVHKKGMLFGMWMEPESMSGESETFANHPEWKLEADISGQTDHHVLIDLSNAEAAKYVEDAIIKIISEFKLDFYKTDLNLRFPVGGLNRRDGYAENEAWRHYEVIYGIYDRVLKEFPDVALEDCAAGGGRLDLGMMSRFHYGCQSDFSYFPRSIRSINALTLFLPPESLIYYHNHLSFAHEMADMDTHLRVTLFAIPAFVGFGAQNAERSGVYFEKTRKYIELVKGFCRSIMAGHPIVYHHTPYIGLMDPADWCILEYASPERTKGYAGIFRLGNGSEQNEYIFKPRGIDCSRNYTVTTDNNNTAFTVSGTDLASKGLSIYLENPNTSELILYSAVD